MVHSRVRRDGHAVPQGVPHSSAHQPSPDEQCHCLNFLDPYPNGSTSQWRSPAAPVSQQLQHYCRVCNTQLNSCKQSRIHVEGKKHEKRLAYLKFCLDTSEAATSGYNTQYPGPAPVTSCPVMSTAMPTVYAYPPPCTSYSAGPTYYYPQPPTYPAPGPHHYPGQHTQHTQYHDYGPTVTVHHPPPSPHVSSSQAPPVSHPPTASHGVMSPSLTSGFSGSGDCKSTETCSLLSVASYSSAKQGPGGRDSRDCRDQADQDPPRSSEPRARSSVLCSTCHLPFPSRAVLDHHLMGSRHARKVKAEMVLRKLVDGGAEFRHDDGFTEIKCEVCNVTVNSSHQMQAHLAGHKHKVRCFRLGVKLNQAVLTPLTPTLTLLTPSSSTAPSTTPSEASAPVRSRSVLVGRPQFGSRPNLAQGRGLVHGVRGVVSTKGRPKEGAKMKSRKLVRPRQKTQEKKDHDSTTESDDPQCQEMTTKESSKNTMVKCEATNGEDSVEHHKKSIDFSDEAKESEDEVAGGDSGAEARPISFRCNICQISLNSQSQMAQHMGSNKHRQRQGEVKSGQWKEDHAQLSRDHPKGQHQWKEDHAQLSRDHSKGQHQWKEGSLPRDHNVREIPMLNMFLQRLHQHHYFPPIRDDEETTAETDR